MATVRTNAQIIGILATLVALLSFPAAAIELSQARSALLDGDVDQLSTGFEEHQTAFDADQIDRDAYMDPFYAFATTESKMRSTIEAWLGASPDSIQARSAHAIMQVHRANLLHGPHQPGQIPSAARERVRAIAEPTEVELIAVLKERPDHLPSAYALDLLAALSGYDEQRAFAQALLAEYDAPLPALLASLRFAKFDAWPTDANRLCSERAKEIEGFASSQCMAFAKIERGRYAHRGIGGLHSTLPDAPILLVQGLETRKSLRVDPNASLGFAVASRSTPSAEVMNLAYRLGPDRIVQELVQPRLEVDPLNPQWLSVLAQIQFQMGRPSLAWQTIETALELGAHDPSVRLARVKFMGANQDMRWNATEELLDAFSATDGSIKIVTTFLNRIMSPPDTLIDRADGTVNPNFECLQLLFVERFTEWCAQVEDATGKAPSHKCKSNAATQMNALADRIRSAEVCGPNNGWRERTAWLLEHQQ